MADHAVEGKIGRVTSTITAGRLGEVMILVRGGSEAFNARSTDANEVIATGTRVVVVEYYPPRTVIVTPM